MRDDIGLMNALAASYAGFQQFETAFALLNMSQHLHARNPETLRIRAVVAMQADAQDEALAALDALEALTDLDADMVRLRDHAMAMNAA